MLATIINLPHTGSISSEILVGDSLALGAVAGVCTDEGWETTVLDTCLHRWDVKDLLARIPAETRFLGVSIMHHGGWPLARRAIELARTSFADACICVGGSGPSLDPVRYAVDGLVNVVFSGNDLEALRKILRAKRGEKNRHTAAQVVHAQLEGGYYDQPTLRPNVRASYERDHIVQFESSKGCHGCCSFCAVRAINAGRWSAKPVTPLLREIDDAMCQVPQCRDIRFVDANFLGAGRSRPDRALRIAESLGDRSLHFRFECRVDDVSSEFFPRLRNKGLVGIYLGIESGCQNTLNAIRKGIDVENSLRTVRLLKSLGISWSFGFMMLCAGSADSDIDVNVGFLAKIGYGLRWKHFFHKLTPLEQPEGEDLSVTGSKLSDFWTLLRSHHEALLKRESVIGHMLERYKEAGVEGAWDIDSAFGEYSISTFKRLVSDLRSSNGRDRKPREIVDRYAEIFEGILEDVEKRVRRLQLPDRVWAEVLDRVWSPTDDEESVGPTLRAHRTHHAVKRRH